MNLFKELRHRNVFRVAIAYLVAGWLIAQVADLVGGAFNWPDVFLQMIIGLLALGFPVALIFAWAFELTPEGLKRANEVPADAPKDPRTGRYLNLITILALVLTVSWLSWDKLHRDAGRRDPHVVADRTIAVLPFADYSPNADHAWFADGLTDEILNALARTRSLSVASRTSSFAYRGTNKDAKTIANELDVAHILEGSVRRAGDRIRVTAQLIRASDDAHLWSDTFDADSADSIEIQERIAFDIASLLDTAMDPEEIRRMVAAGTESIAAWEAFLQMRSLHYMTQSDFITAARSEEILALYRKAIDEDPEFGEAHLLAARVFSDWLNPSDISVPPGEISEAELADFLVEASTLASRYARNEDARLGAEILRAGFELRFSDLVELTRARLEFQPNSSDAWNAHLAALLTVSRFDEARRFSERIANHDFDDDERLPGLYDVAKVNIDVALAGASDMLEKLSPTPAELYQSHRILLYGGRVEEARPVGQRYINSSTDPAWALMVRIRQACAEERFEDAAAHYAEYDFTPLDITSSSVQWLALQTLGRVDDARELIRPLDTPRYLFRLAGLLPYTHFDPSPFPNLMQVLEEQGALPREPEYPAFFCKR